MMIENDQSWQTNIHPQPLIQSGLAATLVAENRESTPCQGSADKLHDGNTSCCTYISARYFSSGSLQGTSCDEVTEEAADRERRMPKCLILNCIV